MFVTRIELCQIIANEAGRFTSIEQRNKVANKFNEVYTDKQIIESFAYIGHKITRAGSGRYLVNSSI